MNINQWEIWMVDSNPTKGEETSKLRPVIVVNDQHLGKLNLRVVVPITDVKVVNVWHHEIIPNKANGLSKNSAADCFQLKSLSCDRFVKKIGSLDTINQPYIQLKMMLVLGLKV
jgi:mRNA interferase MazF